MSGQNCLKYSNFIEKYFIKKVAKSYLMFSTPNLCTLLKKIKLKACTAYNNLPLLTLKIKKCSIFVSTKIEL